MRELSREELLTRIEELEQQLIDSEQMVEAIKMGEVDAFAINKDNQSQVYTLQSGDYAYRVLIEEFSEGAINVTEDGLIVYTNPYFCELMESSYNQMIGSSITDFIGEDSKLKFDKLFQGSLQKKTKGEINLTVNGKIIPVFVYLTSLRPHIATVGIIFTDLTEKKRNEEVILEYQDNLEKKNNELNQNNKELASFAYVASHDLQEPLRKIQLYSSRIMERELNDVSDTGKDYFNRIIGSAKRMQDLIQDLLAYSRTDTVKGVFEMVELSSVLEDVKLELMEEIELNDASINLISSCKVNVITFQFRQLLNNLISNALKFSRPGQSPQIKIESDIITDLDIDEVPKKRDKSYCRIVITDNGIGFAQEYSEKIFQLFQRLHGKSEYSGTGIGLAIVKKIVENHNGYISASSGVGQGAVFTIYIPEI
ncbi:sensor histidine kinase [Arenibacter certesii]|uniref:histidine kinase n=1 Tax=Arenibacter certesii TaxID=228955 RepID=A0A918INR0_9FLAO|nr:ATP-binding protein [Arenibacter certesii]GGW23013.1 hypothetical protein GCM10007383_03710 [Arenibacter certesii]